MNPDYRNTTHDDKLCDLINKKSSLKEMICCEHPRAVNHYNFVSDKKNNYCNCFMRMYNYKCGYCGLSIKIIEKAQFEVDHYIPKTTKSGYKPINRLENLALSCSDCNGKKLNFESDPEHRSLFNPDCDISRTFFRDEDYYIRIDKKYCNDSQVKEFYNKMKFSAEYRRLDYLIMEIQDYCDNCDDKNKTDPLYQVIERLKRCRCAMSK